MNALSMEEKKDEAIITNGFDRAHNFDHFVILIFIICFLNIEMTQVFAMIYSYWTYLVQTTII